MEIDIPSLNDVAFIESCEWCNYNAHGVEPGVVIRSERVDRGKGTRPRYETVESRTSCVRCGGSGYVLTPVGDRLVRFLNKLGLLPDAGIDTRAIRWAKEDA